MKTAAFIIGLVFICCEFTETTTEAQQEGFPEQFVQSECRDRYLWIHVASGQTPRFEAVDENGVHSISEQLASRCGYTISTFKMDGFTTFRASYYSCFTHNQNDEVFTFRFNVMVVGAGGGWSTRPVSAVCFGLTWTHREVICEEDYMEVNVNRESSCGGRGGGSGLMWQAAFSQAQRTASSDWQLMILQSDRQVSSMSIREAQRRGYSLTATARRVVLRSQYKQPLAELTMVDGVPVEVLRASLFFKQKLVVVMMDVSMACTVNSGSFDGARLLWDVPRVVTPLVGTGAGFESQSLGLGVEGVLLDAPTAAARGFSLDQQGHLIQIGVPFGAEGGYRKSLVANNVYKETYTIFLLYEHIFSLLYDDGSVVDTRHRMLRVLDTPLLCRPPFSLDQTGKDDQVFSVYLGNIPADVLLEVVQINGKQVVMSESTGGRYSISPVVHINGSRAYELRLPFEDGVVDQMYLGQGVVQYSADINFTLTIMPHGDSYYHHTLLTARVFGAFPPEITAQCSDRGITFSVVRSPRAESLWEVGFDHEPLTSQLVTQRGYRLHNDTHRTTLEVPVFSIGYSYEGINLSNFYGTFKLFLRDSKTLEVQTSTSKRCLFKTQDMIVCSADGTMTVVTTLTSTLPTVQPEETTLLDPNCGPKLTDGSRVLFEFQLDSCGTRASVGDSYAVYENEILHDRRTFADGPNLISRESRFKLTVRCFYLLSAASRLSVDRIFRSGTPGVGSIEVFKSVKADSANKLPAQDCLHRASVNAVNTPTDQINQTPTAGEVLPRPRPGPSHFITETAEHNTLLHPAQNHHLSPPEGSTVGTYQVPLQASSHPGHPVPQTWNQHVLGSPTSYQLPDDSIRPPNLDTPSFTSVAVRGDGSGLTDGGLTLGFSSFSRTPGSPVIDQGSNSVNDDVWHFGLRWSQPTLRQNAFMNPNQDLQSLKVHLSPTMQEPTQQPETSLDLSLFVSSGDRINMAKTEENPDYQPQSPYDHPEPSQPQPVPRPPSVNTKHVASKITVSNSVDPQGSASTKPTSAVTSQVHHNLGKPGSIERRNLETVQSRVQNIRVKPLSKFLSSGHHRNQRPLVQQVNSQISNPSQSATGPTAVNSDRNHQTPQRLPDPRGLKMRLEQVPERKGFSTLKQQQAAHGVQVESDQTAAIRLSAPSPDRQGHQQTQVQSVSESGMSGRQKFSSTERNVLKATGESPISVRLVPGHPARLPTHNEPNLQSETRGDTRRMSYPSLKMQHVSNTPAREHRPNLPTAGVGAGKPSPHTDGADGSGSSDCSHLYGSSVHRGIKRG